MFSPDVVWTAGMRIMGFELVPGTGQCFPARLWDFRRLMRTNLQGSNGARAVQAVLGYRMVLSNPIRLGFSGLYGRGGQVRGPIPLSLATGCGAGG